MPAVFALLHPIMACLLLLAGLALPCRPLLAGGEGRIVATGGATQVEGSGGGGLVPWATITGYAAQGQHGLDLTVSTVRAADLDLQVAALAYGADDRFELSLARQQLELDGGGGPLRLDVLGAKYRLAGDLIYGRLPQFSVGLQLKRQHDAGQRQALGSGRARGADVYLAASRLLLDGPWHRNLLLNATLRSTEARQGGLLGFGGGRSLQLEAAAALLPNPHLALGAEYRSKPDTLPGLREDDWWDLFAAWFPNKRWTLVLGYADLGTVAGLPDQRGTYFSLKWTP